ncbi:3-DEOXY-D-MANNO-OCTULOSONIC-ACID TRANSFERASE/TRNA GUANINE-N 7 - -METHYLTRANSFERASE [Salix koriyanagi]|uniref:tRNA (guanine(46)-N(7))-methyltransferase n=1 Tax=Salix koriyanagi TaxID=2511006 RepID=A0A9Q0VZJ8_9ROSI|nr:3-DEOXY-D-MANNO-OCTULOSONIC-ACID TRANSFERASE/TRNA GUANINE-N 7 - -METHYLTRANSFERASE [Salix koriyanagi]
MAASLGLHCHHFHVAAAAANPLRKAAKQLLSSLILKSSKPNHHHYNNIHCCCYDSVGAKEIRSPDLVALEYADLNLSDKISGEWGHVRIRQHVNPLSSSFTVPAQVPDWKEVFRDPTLPLMVDIGSGSGRFLIWLAKRNPDSGNYLGLEIRQKLVKRAEFWVKELALTNIHFLFANAAISFRQLVLTYPGPLMLVSILCPDPHFKKRHHKRRVVQKTLVDNIIGHLVPGGKVFFQSDVLDVAQHMRNQFDAESDALQHIDELDPSVPCDNDGWLLDNPIGIRTEREIHAEFEGAKIYRRLYQKRT